MSRILLITYLLIVPLLEVSPSNLQENRMKAAWLKKIARFIHWPGIPSGNEPETHFFIGIIGKYALYDVLVSEYKKHKIKEKKVLILQLDSIDDPHLVKCRMLFIAPSFKGKLAQLLHKIHEKPILTIGDTHGFAGKGVHVNFVRVNRKLRFEINPTSIKKASLSIDPSFLNIGDRVKSKENNLGEDTERRKGDER